MSIMWRWDAHAIPSLIQRMRLMLQMELSKRLDYARQLMLRLEFAPDDDTYQMTYQKLMDVLTKLRGNI
jgi:hypothetical protein